MKKENKNEAQLQAEIVREFSQKHPEENGLLWSTRNTTFSGNDGATQKALGMVAGVADLIYFSGGYFLAIEVKFPGATHKVTHVRRQIDWGKKIANQGGEYYIVTSLKGFWDVMGGEFFDGPPDVYSLSILEGLMKTTKKTIKF